MAEKTLRPSFRKAGVASALIFAAAVILGAWGVVKTSLSGTALYSGIALFAVILFLGLFNTRKKLPFIPLFRASTWLKWHEYLGYLSIVLFLVHVNFRLPAGVLETLLALVFVFVVLSGIAGMILSRKLPRLMTRAGETLTYERIPRHRVEVRDSVHKLIIESEESCRSSTLSEFYSEHLRGFLEERPSVFFPFGIEKRRASYRLRNELEARMRYLSKEEKPIALELGEWIETKENIDYQESAQRILKGWLFIHIPLTVSLILLGIAHGVMAIIYGGNA